ncbi:winged helix-turn-helix domain-containing protein [Streptomyces sp. WAC 05379]|uniref:winged helix-turn-helix domain-containing protein n=1 Tax=Streptomyces sp. WAC 05379 TaxID=2203207 RepID=UPI0021AD9238|nr:winged helix-turn-helix domain-containing protein [Streptomyces sp. WAC 05379]
MEAQQAGDGREFQRVADELRARMTDGSYRLGSFLPSQRDLAEEFEVSRDTVQRALRELVDEGWIESRQGSGSRVVETQRIQSATPKATRSRRGIVPVWRIQQQADRIRGRSISPRRITLRMLLPAETHPLPYPRVKDDKDDPRLRERLHGITERHAKSLRESLAALKTEGLVPSVDVEIRRTPLTPTFKLSLFNGAEALHGPYEVIERKIELEPGEEITALDVLGLGATLTHHVRGDDPNASGTVFVESMQKWFDSAWDHLSASE